MSWDFATENGTVTVRQAGDTAVCQALRATDGQGLYKAWLRGAGGKLLLGTLIPEGGALRLRRTIPVSRLEQQGVWPPLGAEVALAVPFTQEKNRPPRGWKPISDPARLMGDPMLAKAARRLTGVLTQSDERGFALAVPFDVHAPFPMPPLMCLARVETLDARPYVIFNFNRRGCPKFPYIG